jgi:RND family efflux transporter MFP subunit
MSPVPPQPPQPPAPRTLKPAALAAAAIAVLVVAGGLASRAYSVRSEAHWSAVQAAPTVSLARLSTGGADNLTLPGAVQPYRTAQIYARVNGYLTDWRRDIGAEVRAGQVLAVIDAPDLDQQLEQARGDLATAQANAKLADLTASRWSALLTHQAVSQQSADEKSGDAQAKAAAAAAAGANVRRLEALAAFKQVRAPFDGLVTARKTDVGALINAGAGGQELFEVSDLHRLRIYVQVPQTLSAQLAPGQSATFEAPQFPGRVFQAQVVAVSHLLAANSRTMQVELQTDNPGDLLAAGSYCQVHFDLAGQTAAIRVPATALIAQPGATRVAVLGPGDRVQLRRVTLGRDLGNAVEVTSGLSASDRVIDSPPETLADGQVVRLAQASAATPQPKGA